jgi:hypothetical protein
MSNDAVLQKKHDYMAGVLYDLLLSTDKSEEYGSLFNKMGMNIRRTTHAQLHKIANYFAEFILQDLPKNSRTLSDAATDRITNTCLAKALEKFVNEQEAATA